MLSASRQFESACAIIASLRAAGYEAYLAGGCVRDLLLGREPSDYDVATSATPDVVLEMFPRTFAVGAHFGVVLVATEVGGADAGGEKPEFALTEVATFRSDGAYSDGRHPDAVRYTLSAEEDVRRRDFTINGLLLDPARLLPQGLKPGSEGELNVRAEARTLQTEARSLQAQSSALPAEARALQSEDHPSVAKALLHDEPEAARLKPSPFKAPERLSAAPEMPGALEAAVNCVSIDFTNLLSAVIDYVGGVDDLRRGIVRAIGRPELRFEEDHLRMLRGVRFAARFGFELDAAAAAATRRLAAKTAAVSRERVRDELTRMLTEGHARRAFELLDETGLLAEVLPEVARMKGVAQPPQFHPEGDVWTHTLLLLAQLEPGCAPTLAWGALLHDVGKPPTFRVADRIGFDGHVDVGVAMGAEVCRRFRFSNEDTRQILALIENHMRFADAQRMKASTLKRFFRLENFPEHLALHRMDCLAGSGNLDHYNYTRERYESMPEEQVRPKPLITGRELIAAGYQPGAGFKAMLHAVEEAQLEGSIQTPDEALELIRGQFRV